MLAVDGESESTILRSGTARFSGAASWRRLGAGGDATGFAGAMDEPVLALAAPETDAGIGRVAKTLLRRDRRSTTHFNTT